MVQIENNKKMIITIETGNAVSDLKNFQSSILSAIKNYRIDGTNEDDTTLVYLIDLLQELQPTHEQLNYLFKVEKVESLN